MRRTRAGSNSACARCASGCATTPRSTCCPMSCCGCCACSVSRSAKRARSVPASRRRFTKADFGPLEEHYRERNFQVHVVQEYARRAMQKLSDAVRFIAAYFTLPRRDFVRMFFADRKDVLKRATTAESYRRIVEELR